MRKIKLFIAISIDGYIATSTGDLEWLTDYNNPKEIDYGYEDFYSTIDTLVMGSNTYQSITSLGMEWPYLNKNSYVVSREIKKDLPKNTFHLFSDDLKSKLNELKQEAGRDIWLVGGGRLVSSFLNEDLVDSMTITTIPIILGEGISLFPSVKKLSKWKVTEFEHFYNGVIVSTYERFEE